MTQLVGCVLAADVGSGGRESLGGERSVGWQRWRKAAASSHDSLRVKATSAARAGSGDGSRASPECQSACSGQRRQLSSFAVRHAGQPKTWSTHCVLDRREDEDEQQGRGDNQLFVASIKLV